MATCCPVGNLKCGVLYWSASLALTCTIYNLQHVNPGGSHFIVSIKDAANTPAWRWFLFETQIFFWWIHILIKIRFVSTVVLEWSCQVCWDTVDHDNRDHHDRRDRHESMTMMLTMIIMIVPGGIDANSTMISSVEFWDAATGRWEELYFDRFSCFGELGEYCFQNYSTLKEKKIERHH